MIAYATDYHPPAPVIQVSVGSVVNRRLRRTVRALLDTGADITAIPASSVDPLRHYPTGELQLEGIIGANQTG